MGNLFRGENAHICRWILFEGKLVITPDEDTFIYLFSIISSISFDTIVVSEIGLYSIASAIFFALSFTKGNISVFMQSSDI